MKSKAYNGEVRSSEKDFETLQLGAFATPGLFLAHRVCGTAESGFRGQGWKKGGRKKYIVGAFSVMPEGASG
jgi:hypothetical protein